MIDYSTGTPSYQQAAQTLQGIYGQQYADLYQQYQGAMSQGLQQMNQSGMGGSTANPSLRMGYFSQYTQAMNRIAAQQAQQQIGLGQSYAGLGLQQQGQANQLATGMANVGLGYAQLNAQQQGQQNGYMQSMIANDQSGAYTGTVNPGSYMSADSAGMMAGASMFNGNGGMFQ